MRNFHPDEVVTSWIQSPLSNVNNIFKVQDEFLEEPEMRELEKIAEEMMTPRQAGRRKRGEESSKKEEKGENIGEASDQAIFEAGTCIGDVSNCPHCNKTFPVGSLQHHLRTAHSQVGWLEGQSA